MVNKKIMVDIATGEESEWEINPGKSDKTVDAYVSIESNLKPGMYLTVGKELSEGVYEVVLSQYVNGTPDEANSMTFRTLLGFIGKGVTFESVLHPQHYLTSRGQKLILASQATDEEVSFNVKALNKDE